MKIIVNYILLIYFSIGTCIPNCDFSQISQLDNLSKHYELHQIEALELGAELSFTEFLYIHFIEGDEHQHQNENNHQNLPLHALSNGIILFFNLPIDTKKLIVQVIEKRKETYLNTFYINPFINQIFHPPTKFH